MPQMDLAQMVDLIIRLGFPVVVAIWFMVRYEKRMDKMIILMTQIITKLDGK